MTKRIRKVSIILFVFCFPFICKSQHTEQKYKQILITDSTWDKEIIPFPINFAPQINFEGYEDAQFPPGWGKEESEEFWSYIFAWNISGVKTLTEEELTSNIKLYFDGLMDVVNDDKSITIPPTAANFTKQNIGKYSGNVAVYDAFRSKKNITLNVLVEHHYCEQKKKTIVIFRFSPKSFDHTIWNMLMEAKLDEEYCIN
jgi:hypothetical protein